MDLFGFRWKQQCSVMTPFNASEHVMKIREEERDVGKEEEEKSERESGEG